MVPIVSPIAFAMAPPVSESKLELKAHAQALVPIGEEYLSLIYIFEDKEDSNQFSAHLLNTPISYSNQ